MARRVDLTGQRFGDLVMIKLSDKRDKHNTLLWQCRCLACGREDVYVLGGSLKAGHYKSCGCKRVAKRDQGARQHEEKDQVDGTRKSALKSKLHVNNSSGVKGVRFNQQRGKWTSHIGFRGKQINLGYFANKDDAIKARKLAEEKYHKPYLEDDSSD